MATLLNTMEDEDKDQQPGSQQLSTASASGGAAAGGGTGGVGGASGGSAAKPTRTGFVNLSRYVDANKQGTENMAGTIGGNISGQQDTARTGLNDANSSFKTGAAKQNLGVNQKAVSGLAGSGDLSSVLNGTYAHESQGGGQVSQGYAGELQRMRDAKYTGPMGLSNSYQPAFDKAQADSDATGDVQGRKGLLQSNFNRDNYSQGMVGLDQALLGGDQGAQERFSNIRKAMGQLGDERSSAISNAESTVAARQAEAAKARGAFQGAMGKRQAFEEGRIDDRVRSANEDREAQYQRALKEMGAGYVTKGNALTSQDFIGGGEKAKFEALNKLMGKQGYNTTYQAPTSAAYTADTAGYNADQEQAIKDRQATLDRIKGDKARGADKRQSAAEFQEGQNKMAYKQYAADVYRQGGGAKTYEEWKRSQ